MLTNVSPHKMNTLMKYLHKKTSDIANFNFHEQSVNLKIAKCRTCRNKVIYSMSIYTALVQHSMSGGSIEIILVFLSLIFLSQLLFVSTRYQLWWLCIWVKKIRLRPCPFWRKLWHGPGKIRWVNCPLLVKEWLLKCVHLSVCVCMRPSVDTISGYPLTATPLSVSHQSFLKFCRCFLGSARKCILFGYNPWNTCSRT